MTDVVLISFCAVIALALIVIGLLVWFWRAAVTEEQAALVEEAHATRNETLAEQQRDQENAARLGAEATRDELAKQLTATQAALDASRKELVQHVHDLVASGSPAALDAFRRVFAAELPTAGAAGHPADDHGGGAAAAVPAAGAAPAARAGEPHPGA